MSITLLFCLKVQFDEGSFAFLCWSCRIKSDTSDQKKKEYLEHKKSFIEHHNHDELSGSKTADHKAGYKNRTILFVKLGFAIGTKVKRLTDTIFQ